MKKEPKKLRLQEIQDKSATPFCEHISSEGIDNSHIEVLPTFEGITESNLPQA